MRRKRLNLSQVSAETRVQIAKLARMKTRSHCEIAQLFNVRTTTVSAISSIVKRGKPSIMNRRTKELKRSHNYATIVSAIMRLLDQRKSIWSARQVQRLVKEQFGQVVKLSLVLSVLKNQFRLSYRKIKRVPFQGNSERSKVLRSLYAQKMLEVYASGKRIINIDESWIPVADFH